MIKSINKSLKKNEPHKTQIVIKEIKLLDIEIKRKN
jgi:hypothetical protein